MELKEQEKIYFGRESKDGSGMAGFANVSFWKFGDITPYGQDPDKKGGSDSEEEEEEEEEEE